MNYIKRFNENLNDFQYSIGVNRFYNDIISFFKKNHSNDLNIFNDFELAEYSFLVKIGNYEFNLKFEKDTNRNSNGGEFGYYDDKAINPYIKLYYENGEDIIDVLKRNESNLKHEITHYFDYLKRNRTLNSSTVVLKTSGEKSYYNTVEEINAYFIQACTDVICMMKVNRKMVLKNFATFKRYFLTNIAAFYMNLTVKNREIVDKRMFAFFEKVKTVISLS